MTVELNSEQAVYFRDQFREARAHALRDAEGFQKLLFALERFGSFLIGRIGDLGKYKECIQQIALKSPLAEQVPRKEKSWHLEFTELYDLVRGARNDALHQGAYARHLTNNAIRLILVLEDALMSKSNKAADFMVRLPICANLWQPLSFVRQQMLESSFSYMPVLQDNENADQWQFVSDYRLAEYLWKEKRKDRLAKNLKDAVQDGLVLESADTCKSDTSVKDLLKSPNGKPILIVDENDSQRLIGIISPFDLL